MYGKCQAIVDSHVIQHDTRSESWRDQHYHACTAPSQRERGIWGMIKSFAVLADDYAANSGWDLLLGQDGYFAEHAADLINGMRAYLNFDVGRFNCGSLDRLICDLAKAAGVELED